MANFQQNSPDQIINGRTRAEWSIAAAKAIIAATDLATLWHMVHMGGILELARLAIPAFEQSTGIKFTMDDVRRTFTYLERFLSQKESQYRSEDIVRKHIPDYQPEAPVDDTIRTESVKHGDKVH